MCLRVNNYHFSGKNFVQKHGKTACIYADLAMGIIDEKAKFGLGNLEPILKIEG